MIKITHKKTAVHRVEYQFETPKKHYQVYFSCPQITLHAGGDTEATLALLAGSRLGHNLLLSTAISSTMADNLRQWQQIMSGWFKEYRPVTITPVAAPNRKPNSGRIGSLFTGGVDSFYTFLKHQDRITDLIYVHGFDLKLDDSERRLAVSMMGQLIANTTGIRFIELETNAIRAFRDYGHWGKQSHGIGLVCASRHLAGYLDELYIPSSFPEKDLMPWGSHPDTDPLFSDENLTIIHDGNEATRAEKIKAIVDNSLAQQHLRVCWTNITGTYNCGLCEKCLRTQTTLFALNNLDKFVTFPNTIDTAAIRKLDLSGASAKSFCQNNLDLLEANNLENTSLYQTWQDAASTAQQPTKSWFARLLHATIYRHRKH